MRLSSVLLLAAVALLVNADTLSAESGMATHDTQDLVLSPIDNWHGTKRFLRMHKYANSVDNEERAISAPSVEMLQGWLKKGLISDDAVGLLSLGNKADDLLTGSLLNAWVSYVKVFNKENPAEKMNMIKTLTTRFGDEALATMIETAKRSTKTADIANKVQVKQIENWLTLGKTPDDIFELLKLNSAKSLLFDQPPVNTWLKYMDDFSQTHAGTQLSTIATLRKHYTDDVLAKMIIVAAKSSKTSDAAKRVEADLMRTWFNSMKTPTDILKLLNLQKTGLSKSPLYPIWTKYVDLFNKVDPKFKTDMLQGWLKKGLITDDTFELLTLGTKADQMLSGSLLSAWSTYIKLFNKENPTEKLSLVATLTARFGDEAVSTMIEVAKKVPKTAAIAKRVQNEQIQSWINAGKIPDDIFVLLKLNTAKTRLFDQPQVNTWVKYVDAFNKAKPKSKMTLFSALASRYDDATLAKMLVVAKTTPDSESLAMRIQAEQRQYWLSIKKTPDNIFEMLKLNTLGFTFLNNPIFSAWVKYTDEFRKVNPGTKLTTIGTLRKYYQYTDEALASLFIKASESTKTASIANRMKAELLREWYITVTPPARVFKLLRLPKTGVKVFESPLYTFWTNYVAYVKKADPAFKGEALSLLRSLYGDKTLSSFLIAAEKVQSTKLTAQNLRKELFDVWRATKLHPIQVYNMLRADRVSSNSPIWTFYSEYSKFYLAKPHPTSN